MQGKRRFGLNIALSLTGTILPAVGGVFGTVLLIMVAPTNASVVVLGVWTILGYMSLSDLGLTRSASKLVASGGAVVSVVGALWRTAAPLGGVLSFIAVLMAVLVSPAIALIAPVPLIAALQFPIVGAIEAQGKFVVLATQRLLNTIFVYLMPPIAIAVLGPDLGVFVGLSLILVGRIALFGYLCARSGVGLYAAISSARERSLKTPMHLLVWVGISSVVGPALLYSDRLALSIGTFSTEQWVSYTAFSELLLKSYVIPSALLAVAFPWLAKNALAHQRQVRKLVGVWLPLATLVGSLIVLAIGVWAPIEGLSKILPLADSEDGRAALLILTAATGWNWITQAYIAVLHALDAQRLVAVLQLAISVPFLVALLLICASGSLAAIAWTVFGRVAILSVLLALASRRALIQRSGEAGNV